MDESTCDTSSSDSQISNYEYQNMQYLLNQSSESNHVIGESDLKSSYKHSINATNVDCKMSSSTKDQSSKNEGYCDHCRRNFCNKYYLKRHKLEVHGIHIVSEKISWKRMKSKEKHNIDNQRVSLEHSVSSFVTSMKQEVSPPINQIVKNPFHIESLHVNSNPTSHDHNRHDKSWSNVSQNSLETKGTQNINFNQYMKPKDNLNMPCPYCYQLFNRSNLVLHHMITNHTDFIQDFMKFLTFSNESLESQRNSKLLHGTIQPNILHLLYGQFINSSNPITDRVKCDVCFKDICNKYYLKLHKQRMHSNNGLQSDFKITTICGDDFCNGSDDDNTAQSIFDNIQSKRDLFTMKTPAASCTEKLQRNIKKFKIEDYNDGNSIFKAPWNLFKLNDSIKSEKKHDDVHGCEKYLMKDRDSMRNEWSYRADSCYENPLDLSLKGSKSTNCQRNIVTYQSVKSTHRSSTRRRRTDRKFIKRYSSYVVQKIKKCQLHKIKNSNEKNKIVFEVKEFITKTYPKNVIGNDVSKTDYIFGKKYIDLPVTRVYKHKPFAFIIQPIL